MPGVFAVGDVRHGSIKRVASSVGEGSMAIAFVHQYLAERSAETNDTLRGKPSPAVGANSFARGGTPR